MKNKNRCALLFWLVQLAVVTTATAQQVDSLQKSSRPMPQKVNLRPSTFEYSAFSPQLVVPAVLIGYGVASLTVGKVKAINHSTKDEIQEHQPDHIRLDNYTQYVPAVLVYGLDAAGLKAKHNLKDRTIILATSQLLNAAMVVPLKHLTQEERPDGSSKLSFPSGHTSTAFSTAQFMFREYKDDHFWLSITGYGFATFTGVYRTLNNRHWVGDVVAGAGFGILSTEMSYWLLPKIKRVFNGKQNNAATAIAPWYQNGAAGLSLVHHF